VADDNPVDQSGLTVGAADHAGAAVPAPGISPGATQTLSEGGDTGEGGSTPEIRVSGIEPSSVWEITIGVPSDLATDLRQDLFARVAAVVHDWEPTDRDGWDADVFGHPASFLREEVDRLRGEVGKLDRELRAASSPLPGSETEWQWGCRDRHGNVHSVGVENEAQARAMLSMTPVRREVGPWIEVPRA